MTANLANILQLGIKEIRSLSRDWTMLILIVYAFSLAIFMAANAKPEALQNASIAFVDEDRSVLSGRIVDAFYPPYFVAPSIVTPQEADAGLDLGQYTFVVTIPPDFERDVRAGRKPAVQLDIDATRMNQAFNGGNSVQQIINGQVREFVARSRIDTDGRIVVEMRSRYNPGLLKSWLEVVVTLVNNVTMLSLVLTGAALIREREHGTIEHLLVMPVTPFEIMTSKIAAMGLVVLIASTFALTVVIRGLLGIPLNGSLALFMLGTTLHLFAMTSLGIFLGTIARSMPQFGLLMILIYVPMIQLSGGQTPRENMPEIIQYIMLASPTTHFVSLAQAILFRGAGLGTVWPSLLALIGIGAAFFAITLTRFRKTIGQMA